MPASKPLVVNIAWMMRALFWWRACRPGFLTVTAVAAGLGIAQAQACGCGWDPLAALVTVLLAVMAHAAANLYNDYGDSIQGSDALNSHRLGPFTGGSRVIQDGGASPTQVRDAAAILFIIVAGGGLLLTARSGPGLLWVGLAGLFLGWVYSSPRSAWMGRGLGELCVAAAWWLVVVGADYVQRHSFSAMAALSGVSQGLLVMGILWVAEFPDAPADAAVGKRTAVVRLGPVPAAWAYLALMLTAYAWVAVWWWLDWLPSTAWWGLGSLPLSLAASYLLLRRAREASRLRPAIALSILAALVHGGLLVAAFVAIARMR